VHIKPFSKAGLNLKTKDYVIYFIICMEPLQLKLKGNAIKLSSSLSHFYMTPSS